MQTPSMRVPPGPGPLNPWVRQHMGENVAPYAQRGSEAIMPAMHDVERMLEDNASTMFIAGMVLGTFVDRRFYLLPLALGGLRLWRSMQHQ
jgi:hypothetical protein